MKNELSPQEARGPIGWMAGHRVASNLVMVLCLVGGLMSLWKIKQEVFPTTDPDTVTVTVAYPGASPEEVESGIVLSIEEAVRPLDGVDEVVSRVNEGSCRISVELLEGTDGPKAAQDIKSEVDRITTFPVDAEEPVVRLDAHRHGVLDLVIYGDVSNSVLHEFGEQARDQLLQDPKITQVDVTGLPSLEIGIEISEENLRRYGLTLDDVASRLRSASLDVPAGGLKTPGGEILVRVKERRDYGSEFARLPIITTSDGSQVLLGQIAKIEDSFEDSDRYTLYNGKRAVSLEVYRVGEQTPIQVSDAVHKRLPDIQAALPAGLQVAIERDRSDIYRQRVELLLTNGAMGLALVLLLLGLFLEARLAFWVMMGIPISFLGSFLFLPATGVTVNMISLFAYIIALGIVVDDAIVVGENIYHYHQQGMTFLKAAVRGAREVARPVTFSILTNMVTFMPLYFMPGFMGKFFKMIPVVVCIVFAISLVESLFVLPRHLGHCRERRRRGLSAWLHHRQQAFGSAFMRWVNRRYGPFLDFTLHHRYLTVAAAAAVLMITLAYAFSGRMGFEMFPKVESDFSQGLVTLPYGSPVEKTEAVMKKFLAGARKVIDESGHPELSEAILTEVGSGGGHFALMRVMLAEPKIRSKIMSTEEFTDRWREAVGEVAGVENMRFASDVGGPGGGRPVAVELGHRDMEVLDRASSELAAVLQDYPNVKDVDDGYQPGKPQLDFRITPEGKSLGLTAQSVSRQVRYAFYGAEVLRQQRGRNEIKVMVRLPEADRETEQTIQDLMLRTPAGTFVPLREVATVDRGRAFNIINRRNGRRVVTVVAGVNPQSKAGEVLGDLKKKTLPALMRKYPGLGYSFQGHQAEMRESIESLWTTVPVALLCIYALLAIPFRSYVQPLVVMTSIPFGVVGAIIGHLIMGYDLSLMSLFGIVALAGVVVNDSLVMIDFANNRRLESPSLTHRQAIHAAGIQRFRAIMLTTLTTFGGLAPMIFETSRQAKFLIPMALSLGFGILFATFITLILVPSLYTGVEDIRRAALAAWRWLFPPRPDEQPAAGQQTGGQQGGIGVIPVADFSSTNQSPDAEIDEGDPGA